MCKFLVLHDEESAADDNGSASAASCHFVPQNLSAAYAWTELYSLVESRRQEDYAKPTPQWML